MTQETVDVKVYSGSSWDSYEEIESQGPDVYTLSPAETDYGRVFEVPSEKRVVLSDEIEHHGTYAFNVDTEQKTVLNVHTNDSYHDPTDWGKPIERGLLFDGETDAEPFGCELWGRIMFWVEVENDE